MASESWPPPSAPRARVRRHDHEISSSEFATSINVGSRPKKLNGRKRHVLMCSAGFLLAVLVTAASLHDKHGLDPLLARVHVAGWRLRRLIGDGAYAGEDVAGDAARHGAALTVALRPQQRRGFIPIPLRWRVEQGLGVLTMRNRRLVRDWEQLPVVSETMMVVANLRRLIRLIARSY